MDRYVIDTNCLISSFSRQSPFFDIWRRFFAGEFQICVSTEIMFEYEEILTRKHGNQIARNILNALQNSQNLMKVDNYYHFNLITQDQDDNKFVDCAIACNARLIVTNDSHFNVLHQIEFPKVDVATLEEFYRLLQGNI